MSCCLSVTSGSGTLCASWQCLEVPRGPPPSLAVQFVGSGTSLSGMDVELVGSRYRMSLVKKRFATGNATCYILWCFTLNDSSINFTFVAIKRLLFVFLVGREVHGRLLPVNHGKALVNFALF